MLPLQKAIISRDQGFSRGVSKWIKELDNDEKTFGGFFDDGYTIWIAQQEKLVVVDTRTGQQIAHYDFGAGFNIDCATPCIIAGHLQGLLIGACSGSRNLACIFDVMANRLLSAVVIPHRVLSVCVIVNGGEVIPNEHYLLHAKLSKWSSLVAVGTIEGHVYLYDANLGARKAISNQLNPSVKSVYIVDDNFAETYGLVDITDFLRPAKNVFRWSTETDTPRHDFLEPDTTAATALLYIKEASMLAIGFSFGGIFLFTLDLLEPLYLSDFEPAAAAVMKFAVVEPDDDPKPTVYLWALRDSDSCKIEGIDSGNEAPSLEMYQLNFQERYQTSNNTNFYVELVHCLSRIYWVPDSCKALLDCVTLNTWPESEKAMAANDQVGATSRILMYFVWLNKNDKLMGCLFDINSWYHAQMPRNVLVLPEYQVCPFVAWHFLGSENVDLTSSFLICALTQYSIVRFRQTPDIQFNYFACSYSLCVDVVTPTGIRRLQVPDVQSLVLDNVTTRAVEALREPKDFISSLQLAKLIPTMNLDCLAEEMRQQIWTAMLENGRFHQLSHCFLSISASGGGLLDEFVEWTWLQAIGSKNRLDEICGLLFDGPTVGIADATKKTLTKETSNLNLLLDALLSCRSRFQQDAESTMHTKLDVRVLALRETCLYAKILLWFVDAEVLPERLGYYRRRSLAGNHQNASKNTGGNGKIFIDDITHELDESLKKGPVEGLLSVTYPLPAFRDVLSVFLISNADSFLKHAFVYYTLLDIENTAMDTVKESAQRFAAEVLLYVDPLLSKYVLTIWHLDKGNDKLASDLLIDALVTWCPKTALKNRFAEAANFLKVRQSTVPTLSFIVPVSIDRTMAMPAWRKQVYQLSVKKPKVSRSIFGRSRLVNDGSDLDSGFSRLEESPSHVSKRTATETVDEYSRIMARPGSVKKARFDTPTTSVARRNDESDSDEDTTTVHGISNFEEAKSLLKAPRTNQTPFLNMPCGRPPVSILKKRNPDVEDSSYMEKSIRFALPPEPSPLSFSETSALSSDNDTKLIELDSSDDRVLNSTQLHSQTYQSPTDEDIRFSFVRHRWSLADLPSPSEAKDAGGAGDELNEDE